MLRFQNDARSQHGVVMVIAALFIVCLMGVTALVVDVGRLFNMHARLQTAADAGALAGAATLFTDKDAVKASQDAQTFVAKNLTETYNYSDTPDIVNNNYTVNLAETVNFYFAPLVGMKSNIVRASATATAKTIISTNGVVPFGVEKQDFVYGQQYTLKYGAGNKPAQGGNYGALALGGNGANRYRDNIKFGYSGQIKIGDTLTTEPGNMSGPTDQGVSYRKSLCTHGCSYATQIEANCPRVVITPVIDQIPSGGKSTTNVVGFAAFFLEDTQTSASKGQRDVIGRFLKWSVTGQAGDGPNFGLTSVWLVK